MRTLEDLMDKMSETQECAFVAAAAMACAAVMTGVVAAYVAFWPLGVALTAAVIAALLAYALRGGDGR